MKTKIISFGAGLASFAVIFGAFGAHALKSRVTPDRLEVFQTGTYYLMIHAIGMVLYGLWYALLAKRDQIKCWPAAFFLLGSFLFTGSLYAIVFTGIKGFGMITPLGGVLFIASWLGFANQVRVGSQEK